MPVESRISLMQIFDLLYAACGPLHWWPAETPFEVCVGAILTQNTTWTNVEKASVTLKRAGILSPEAFRSIDPDELALLIRPAGYFNLKSRRLIEFVSWLYQHHDGSLETMFAGEWEPLRAELLQVRGIGPETADTILLYAGGKPSFVVDTYTRRLFHRLGYLSEDAGYDETRSMFMEALPNDVSLFNEYHAQIVEQCKQHCRKKPLCSRCPLNNLCSFVSL